MPFQVAGRWNTPGCVATSYTPRLCGYRIRVYAQESKIVLRFCDNCIITVSAGRPRPHRVFPWSRFEPRLKPDTIHSLTDIPPRAFGPRGSINGQEPPSVGFVRARLHYHDFFNATAETGVGGLVLPEALCPARLATFATRKNLTLSATFQDVERKRLCELERAKMDQASSLCSA